jgi:type I restriction enzyme S subunit
MSNVVPEGWEETKLGHVASLTMGQSPSSDTYNTEAIGLPFFQGKADFGSRNPRVRYWCNKPTKVADEGSILFSVRAPVGEVNITTTTCCIGRGLTGIKAASADQEFLYQKLQYVKPLFALLSQGSTFEAVNGGEMKEFPLTLPPLPEQKKIAAILASVDEVIEKTRAQIDKLKDLKTGMMQELLTKGIGSDGVPHTEFKDSPVGRIPASWDVLAISAVCSEIVDCVNKTAPVVDYVTPYRMIRTTNVRDGRIKTEGLRYVTPETFNLWTRRLKLEAGDLIFTREAPVGECGLLQEATGLFLGQRTMVYRVNKNKMSNFFLLYSMQSEYCQSQLSDLSGGSTTPHLRVPDCSKILLKVPLISEQKLISESIRGADSLLEKQQDKIAELNSLKKALMQDLLTGKVRVR